MTQVQSEVVLLGAWVSLGGALWVVLDNRPNKENRTYESDEGAT